MVADSVGLDVCVATLGSALDSAVRVDALGAEAGGVKGGFSASKRGAGLAEGQRGASGVGSARVTVILMSGR